MLRKVIGMCIFAADAVGAFLHSKVAALALLVVLSALLFLVARERIDAVCPKWDVVAYEVERMDLEQLFSVLGDEEYCSYAFARLTGGEFSLTMEEEKRLLEALPLTRQGAQLLKDYVLENQVGFHFWKRLIIEYAGLLTDEECSVVLDRFVEIYGEEVK